MTEKYKIYLPREIKARLFNDAELFEFNKNDGSVNLNAFLKELLINYFSPHRERKQQLLDTILSDLGEFSSISKEDASLLADKIINTYLQADSNLSKNDAIVTLTVSGKALQIVQTIENNLLANISLSQYLKELFVSYLSIARGNRERIIFRENFDILEDAIKNNTVVTFSTSSLGKDVTFALNPYIIAVSKEEQCNYILCYDEETGHTRSFRISRITNLFPTTRHFEHNESISEELQEIAHRNPQSASKNVEAKVRLTERGEKMFVMITKNRPEVLKKEGNLYYFNWPSFQLEEYFKRFGKEAVVLEPERSHEIIETFYERGLEAYRKYPRRR